MPSPFGKTKEQILAEMFPGKTEAQIKEMVESFDTIKAKADKVDALEANLSNANGELAQVKTKLTEIEARGPVTPPKLEGNEPTYDWGTDADHAFNERSKPLVGLALETRADIIYDRVVSRLKEDPYFTKFRKEFDELVKSEKNPATRAREDFVENCYNVVFARHRDEVLRDVRAGSGEFFVESGRNQGGGGHNTPPDTSKTLSEEEKREARKFGLTDEKWLETRNSIKFVGGSVQNM